MPVDTDARMTVLKLKWAKMVIFSWDEATGGQEQAGLGWNQSYKD